MYSTLLDAVGDLKKRGFTEDFRYEEDGIRTLSTNRLVRPEELTIVEYHRFEGDSNADDMSVVYAVEASDGTSGIIVDAYGTYSNSALADVLRKVALKEGL